MKQLLWLLTFLRSARIVRLQPKDVLVVNLDEDADAHEARASLERLTKLLREHLGFPVVVIALTHGEEISIVRGDA